MNGLDPWIPRDKIETDDVPILPASTMILIDDRPDLQVLMFLRNNSSGFVADHTIFPGGAIEEDDKNYIWDDLIVGLTKEEAANQLRTEHARSCLLYTSPSPRDGLLSRMPSSA